MNNQEFAPFAVYQGNTKLCNVVTDNIKNIKPVGSRYIALGDIETTFSLGLIKVTQLKNTKVSSKTRKMLAAV